MQMQLRVGHAEGHEECLKFRLEVPIDTDFGTWHTCRSFTAPDSHPNVPCAAL